ncbi:hypothetical protein AVEN_57397-1 [Araneus ventricosus]|uniref:Transposase Tc1-like domain-containing protein n=1 Tax=Araneus ventricosus TaxID=182803 RepID=A0A4Y2CWL8_ARAVE|nr:hypothetical protein AVEN_57397-1 [Araneus ventricosus]
MSVISRDDTKEDGMSACYLISVGYSDGKQKMVSERVSGGASHRRRKGFTEKNDVASTSVSVRTVQRTVINMGSQSRRPTSVPLLTARHKALRLSWARQPYHWTADDWKHVVWSDESRFQLYRTDAHVQVWRQHQ